MFVKQPNFANLYRGSQIDSYDNDNQTPLYVAVQGGHKETVEVLLKNNADVTVTDIYEKNAIYCAAEENMIDVLKVRRSIMLFVN